MVKAGELGGVLEVVLKRLAEFSEKAQKIKGKVKAAMFYPVAVLIVAVGIMILLMVFRGAQVQGRVCRHGHQAAGIHPLRAGHQRRHQESHFGDDGRDRGCVVVLFLLIINKTKFGRLLWDKFKLKMPVLGPVISKVAISRFTRTLGTLVSSGVPILQALTIVKETAGNVIIGNAVGKVHESVKEGETITAPLEGFRRFSADGRQHGGRRRTNRRPAGNAC